MIVLEPHAQHFADISESPVLTARNYEESLAESMAPFPLTIPTLFIDF